MCRLRLWLGFLALATALPEETPRDVLILARARAHMSYLLSRLPNYTCLQTIERSIRRPPRKSIELLDVLRIEVALVDGRELFAWPGSKKFSDQELTSMVGGGGAIGNGSFALHAKSVFQSSSPRFTFKGEGPPDGERQTLRWEYIVPQNLSGYHIRSRGGAEAIVGYHGSILMDAKSLDLLRLEVYGDDLPPKLEIASAADTMEYRRVKLGDEEFLLPYRSELNMVDAYGFESRNRTTFSACRQYSGESTITFEDPAPDDAPKKQTRTIEVPAGLLLETALETPIDESAAVGDPVTVILKKSVKLGTGLAAPKGAFLHGRVTHLRRIQSGVGWMVGLKLFDIEWPDTAGTLNARISDVPTVAMRIRASATYRSVLNEALRKESVFQVPGTRLNLGRGSLILWETTSDSDTSASDKDKQ